MIIGIEISSNFAHFGQPTTGYSALTYPVPTKTTVMGMLGAIAGLDDYFFLNDIKYAVVIKSIRGKRNFIFNGIKNVLSELNLQSDGFKKGRKQFYRELLLDPVYELYVDVSKIDSKFVNTLLELLKDKRSLYPFYLGINSSIGNYKFLGIFESEDMNDSAPIDSFVDHNEDFEIDSDGSYSNIRMATKIEKGRMFSGFVSYIVETSGKSIYCNDISYTKISSEAYGRKNVKFY